MGYRIWTTSADNLFKIFELRFIKTPWICNLNTSESASDDLACRGNDRESARIDFFYFFTQTDGIHSMANRVNHGLTVSAETSDNLMRGNAVVQFLDNEFGNLLRFFGNNHKIFATVDVINDTINEECFGKQTGKREEADFHAERKKGTQTNQKV